MKSSILLCIFCWQKISMQRICMKKCFLFKVESVCCIELFKTGCRRFADGKKRLKRRCRSGRDNSQCDFYAACFDTLVKR
jgi:hypothetical protein